MTDVIALPASVTVERLVLGSIVRDETLLHDTGPVLTQDDFSLEKHRQILKHAFALYDAGKAVDRVTIMTAMRDAGETDAVGGLAYLVDLDEGLPQFPDISAYVRILKDDTARRRIITAAHNLICRAVNHDAPQDILDSMANLAVEITPADAGKGLVSGHQLVERVGVSEILSPRIKRGVEFPWEWMNKATCGMLPGELWVLAAHTSDGKTSAAIQTAVAAAQAQSKSVAIFSLEMEDVSLFQRAVWQLSSVDSERAKRGKLTPDERRRALSAVNALCELPLYLDDGSFSVMEIHARLRRLRSRGPLGLIVVDYLQLLRDGGRHNSRAEAVGANARMLKLMAGEFECPVLLLSQFNRESAKARGNEAPRRPELYDLKESGDIECHASGVWFIYRPTVQDTDRVAVEFILAKQRDGRRNIFGEFWFFPNHQRFDEKDGAHLAGVA